MPVELLYASQVVGPAISTSTAENDLGLGCIVPPNYLYPPKMLEISLRGIASSLAAAQGTLTLKLYIGGLMMSTGALTIAPTLANGSWELLAEVVCQVGGASGKMMCGGRTTGILSPAIGSLIALGGIPAQLANATPGTPTAIDATVANILKATAQFSVSSASNIVQATQLLVKSWG